MLIAPHENSDVKIPDGDYILTDGAGWFTIGGFSIRLKKTDEGVSVSIYAEGEEDSDSLAETYAFDSELEDGCTCDAGGSAGCPICDLDGEA